MSSLCYDKSCKSRNGNNKNTISYIRWHDASSQQGILYLEDIKQEVILESCGFLIRESESHISICVDKYIEHGTFRGVQSIPKNMIVERKDFELD